MALRPLEVHFQARQAKRGEGWQVLATWDNGRTAQVGNFADRAEAEEWIKNKAAAWLPVSSDESSHDVKARGPSEQHVLFAERHDSAPGDT